MSGSTVLLSMVVRIAKWVSTHSVRELLESLKKKLEKGGRFQEGEMVKRE
jgi:hypothetical protein